ncbi:MAG: response regulator [bacterium]
MANKKILVVEDEVMLAELMKERLEFEGFEILIAQNGKEGLLKAMSEKPALILADLMMPEMDGYEMIRIIRSSSDLNKIPIIVVSARGSNDDIEKATGEGATDYLVKPFSYTVLLKKIRDYLK